MSELPSHDLKMSLSFLGSFCSREGLEGVEAEAAGDVGEHVEDDNGGPLHAVNEALEEIGDVGLARAAQPANGREHPSQDEEIRDIHRPKRQLVTESVALLGATEEGSVTESGRVEPASRGVHQEV